MQVVWKISEIWVIKHEVKVYFLTKAQNKHKTKPYGKLMNPSKTIYKIVWLTYKY